MRDNKVCVGRCIDGRISRWRHRHCKMPRCRAATVRRIEDPAEADGVLGTAARRAIRYRAAIVLPIKVRSAIRDADGTAIELK
jgi:hypothetical protein